MPTAFRGHAAFRRSHAHPRRWACHPTDAQYSNSGLQDCIYGASPMLRCALLAVVVGLFVVAWTPAQGDVGVLPVGADGKPLNLDFETGTLKDWTAEGEA